MVNYTVDRFMSNLDKKLAKQLRTVFQAGDQLAAAKVPKAALINVAILATYGHFMDNEVVDDYAELLERLRTALKDGDVKHPDDWFASAICIMASRGETLTIGGFMSLGIDVIYCDLFGIEYVEPRTVGST